VNATNTRPITHPPINIPPSLRARWSSPLDPQPLTPAEDTFILLDALEADLPRLRELSHGHTRKNDIPVVVEIGYPPALPPSGRAFLGMFVRVVVVLVTGVK